MTDSYKFITFNSIIDILIVAILLFTLYNLISGTRTIQTLKGVLIIVSAYFIAQFFELNTFLWLFDKTLEVAAIALVVIFQNELRRIVMKLGEKIPILGNFFDKRKHELLDILPPAIYSLSEKKVGVLIAIERKTGLRGIIEKGVELDAIMTKELIESIFLPKSPLHDGAIIIADDRVAAAGCLLPLTDRTDLAKVFGTRHRAAIGLSEETDAVLVIVSEENGKISIAHERKLFYGLKKENFENTLKRFLFKSTNEQSRSYTKKMQTIFYIISQKVNNIKRSFINKKNDFPFDVSENKVPPKTSNNKTITNASKEKALSEVLKGKK